jgi:hypothetical protein
MNTIHEIRMVKVGSDLWDAVLNQIEDRNNWTAEIGYGGGVVLAEAVYNVGLGGFVAAYPSNNPTRGTCAPKPKVDIETNFDKFTKGKEWDLTIGYLNRHDIDYAGEVEGGNEWTDSDIFKFYLANHGRILHDSAAKV